MPAIILTTYRPFSNGSQYMDWESRNCGRCKKYDFDGETSSSTCPIAEAIADAACDDGEVPHEFAIRMGYLSKTGKENRNYTWDCTERVIGRPGPKTPPPPLPMDQQMKKAGMATLPGFEVPA